MIETMNVGYECVTVYNGLVELCCVGQIDSIKEVFSQMSECERLILDVDFDNVLYMRVGFVTSSSSIKHYYYITESDVSVHGSHHL